MKYEDPISASLAYLKTRLEAMLVLRPDKTASHSIQVHTSWPRDIRQIRLPCLVLLPGELNDNMDLGNGHAVDGTADEYEDGTELVSYGDITVPITIHGICQSEDVRILVFAATKKAIRLIGKEEITLEDYFDMTLGVDINSYGFKEDPEDAERHAWSFQIGISADTEDVQLEPYEEGEFTIEVAVNDGAYIEIPEEPEEE